jgi:hypothetical protein
MNRTLKSQNHIYIKRCSSVIVPEKRHKASGTITEDQHTTDFDIDDICKRNEKIVAKL